VQRGSYSLAQAAGLLLGSGDLIGISEPFRRDRHFDSEPDPGRPLDSKLRPHAAADRPARRQPHRLADAADA
jgi:hypothetical protein